MEMILREEKFNFIPIHDKEFILAFTRDMARLGYEFGDKIGSGYCWGKYMAVYTRAGVKSKAVFARIYIREPGLVLRLFLNKVDKHRGFLEQAPAHIYTVFAGDYGNFKHCHNERDGGCMFRKSYTLANRVIEKCNGSTFEFPDPDIPRIQDYMSLFTEFYPQKAVKAV